MPNEPSPYASLLRSELCVRNALYAAHEQLPHVTSYGTTPVVVYQASPGSAAELRLCCSIPADGAVVDLQRPLVPDAANPDSISISDGDP